MMSPGRKASFAMGAANLWSVSVVCRVSPQARLTYAEQSIPAWVFPPQT
jgi:hypothetical protein